MSVDTPPDSFPAASSSSYTFSGEGPAATAPTKPDLRPSAEFREGLRRQRGDSQVLLFQQIMEYSTPWDVSAEEDRLDGEDL
ncbi:hypothetical protein M405DRAFT_811042, partial [Rhizopogon salebrosus TDB-379]